VPVNRKNRQICSRLKHCSSNFHKTMHKVIHLYGKTYGKNRPPIFLLERSTQSREGERGGRLTGGGSHGGEGALPGSTDQRWKESPGRRPEGRGDGGGGWSRMGGGDTRWGRKRAVALTPLAGPLHIPRQQRQCRPAGAGSAGTTGSAGVDTPAVPPKLPTAQKPSKNCGVLEYGDRYCFFRKGEA
jgi:hypothetical protein